MEAKAEADGAKKSVLCVFEDARCVHEPFGSVILSGPMEIGAGFDEAAAWMNAEYRILNDQRNREEEVDVFQSKGIDRPTIQQGYTTVINTKKYLADVGLKNLPFPMRVASRVSREGQSTVGAIFIEAHIALEL